MEKKFIITTQLVNTKVGIVHHNTVGGENFPKKNIITYHPNIEVATTFDSYQEAEDYKKEISNPFERTFKIENKAL